MYVDRSIDPTADQVRALRDAPDDRPITMINLLKFRQAEVVFQGSVQQVFIGVAGQPETDWDEVLVVRYPSRRHFLAMMADPAYRTALRHRYAGLERTVLLQCSAG